MRTATKRWMCVIRHQWRPKASYVCGLGMSSEACSVRWPHDLREKKKVLGVHEHLSKSWRNSYSNAEDSAGWLSTLNYIVRYDTHTIEFTCLRGRGVFWLYSILDIHAMSGSSLFPEHYFVSLTYRGVVWLTRSWSHSNCMRLQTLIKIVTNKNCIYFLLWKLTDIFHVSYFSCIQNPLFPEDFLEQKIMLYYLYGH